MLIESAVKRLQALGSAWTISAAEVMDEDGEDERVAEAELVVGFEEMEVEVRERARKRRGG